MSLKEIKPTLITESGFLFVKYISVQNETLELNVDFNNLINEVRAERMDKFLIPFQ